MKSHKIFSVVSILALLLSAAPSLSASAASQPDFGPNVMIFDPSMSTSQIQASVDAIASQQVDNEMGTQRYALLFKPGTYGSATQPLIFQVGYYTEVAGLGASPTDVTINGHVDVYNRCLTPTNCIALVNFWRSLSNLTINVIGTGLDGCRASGDFWAVSQAAPMRRVNITGGNLTLMDYCTAGPQYASGGFIAVAIGVDYLDTLFFSELVNGLLHDHVHLPGLQVVDHPNFLECFHFRSSGSRGRRARRSQSFR